MSFLARLSTSLSSWFFNYATWSFFPEHHFRGWPKLMLSFFVIPFHLERLDWSWPCILLVVPIIFRCISPFALCRRWLVTSSWNLSTNVSWSSSTFWALPGYQSNSRWEIPSFPLNDLCYHQQHYCLPSKRKLVLVLCRTLSSLLSNLCYVLPWSITIFYVKNAVRISPPLKNYWYKWYFLPSLFISWSPCCF